MTVFSWFLVQFNKLLVIFIVFVRILRYLLMTHCTFIIAFKSTANAASLLGRGAVSLSILQKIPHMWFELSGWCILELRTWGWPIFLTFSLQINSQKKKTGVIAPKRFVQRLRKENDVFRGYMHQVCTGKMGSSKSLLIRSIAILDEQ